MKIYSEKRKFHTRPFTKSEKVLLSLLSLMILIWTSHRFVFQPQAEKLYNLEAKKADYEMQIIDINNRLKSEEKIKKERETLHTEREQILSRYFPTLDQSQIIYLLNDLTSGDNFKVEDLIFSRPFIEELGEIGVRNMEVSIPFSGNYDGIMDIINSFEGSPRRILVNSLSLNRRNSDDLTGEMSLKIYSLEGIADTDPNVIFVDNVDDVDNMKSSIPFESYDDFKDSSFELDHYKSVFSNDVSGNEKILSPDIKEDMREQLLHEFDNHTYTFIPSSPMVKGDATPSAFKKSGKYAMRFEYNILALEAENRAYIDLSSENIVLNIPPDMIGTWVYSYGYSPGILGMRLVTQDGEFVDVTMAEGISWIGWTYLEMNLPSDLSRYPLRLDKLYYGLPFNRDDFGILLIDKMEAFYRLNNKEETIVSDQESYLFYMVEAGDTVTKISESVYGTDQYKNEIMELNEIKVEDVLMAGKVLVLKRYEGMIR